MALIVAQCMAETRRNKRSNTNLRQILNLYIICKILNDLERTNTHEDWHKVQVYHARDESDEGGRGIGCNYTPWKQESTKKI